jgi:hypothetical protein
LANSPVFSNILAATAFCRRTIVYTNFVRIVTGSNRFVNQNALESLSLSAKRKMILLFTMNKRVLSRILLSGLAALGLKTGAAERVSRLGIHHAGESTRVYQKRGGLQAMNHRKTLEAKELRALIQPNEGA